MLAQMFLSLAPYVQCASVRAASTAYQYDYSVVFALPLSLPRRRRGPRARLLAGAPVRRRVHLVPKDLYFGRRCDGLGVVLEVRLRSSAASGYE